MGSIFYIIFQNNLLSYVSDVKLYLISDPKDNDHLYASRSTFRTKVICLSKLLSMEEEQLMMNP